MLGQNDGGLGKVDGVLSTLSGFSDTVRVSLASLQKFKPSFMSNGVCFEHTGYQISQASIHKLFLVKALRVVRIF